MDFRRNERSAVASLLDRDRGCPWKLANRMTQTESHLLMLGENKKGDESKI